MVSFIIIDWAKQCIVSSSVEVRAVTPASTVFHFQAANSMRKSIKSIESAHLWTDAFIDCQTQECPNLFYVGINNVASISCNGKRSLDRYYDY